MEYVYYPGCSLEGTALEYNLATRAVMAAAGATLAEQDDWTCCGATAAGGVSRLLAMVLPARNLALAEKMHPDLDILVPCSACYLNLKKVEINIRSDPGLLEEINAVLAKEKLTLTGTATVKHLLEVLSVDLGSEAIAAKVIRPLNGLAVAPYYGCQCLRPYAVFDNPEEPCAMNGLLRATGAQPVDWTMGPKCCGASHMNTKMDVGLELSGAILAAAQGADAIATVCPMCQLNLEGYQKKISSLRAESMQISILYLPQIIGLAMGLPEQDLKINLNLAITDEFKDKISQQAIEQQAAV